MGTIVTLTTYVVLVVLLLWGVKIKRGGFYEDSTSLEVMKSLRGFAAVGVILHYVKNHREAGINQQ